MVEDEDSEAADEADAVARAHAERGALQQEAGAGTQLDALGGDGHKKSILVVSGAAQDRPKARASAARTTRS